MSAPNFVSMNYDMPMICGKTYGQMQKDLTEEYGREATEDELYWYENDMFSDAEDMAEEMNSSLEFHKITVVGGRYASFQFCVDETYSDKFDLDKDSEYCIDNEDAHYYFDMCRSKVLRAADAEKRKIRKWLNGLIKFGFNHVVCTEIFSNGEAEYRVVA